MNPLAIDRPALSAIMVTPDRFETLLQTLRHLRAQTAAAQMEIVIVAPSAARLGLDERLLAPFHSYQVVEADTARSTAAARAAGVRAASARVVAMTEDHSFPVRGWAAALIERHREPWTVVGPAVLNGNPLSLLSWVNLLIEHGPWVAPVESGAREHVAPHNSSYKRDALLAYGNELDALIEAETVLQWDLRARGHAIFLEANARTRHFNVSRLGAWLPLRFNVGRMFACARARRWTARRRVAYALAAPVMPIVRFCRTVPAVRRCDRRHGLFPRVLPLLLLGFIIDGCGELIGYGWGAGDAAANASRFEFHRDRNLRTDERRVFTQA